LSPGAAALIERLAQHRMLGGAPHAELEWLVRHGALRSSAAGEVVLPAGQADETLQIVLSGSLAARLHRGGGERRLFSWRAGDVCGVLPYSRFVAAPGDTVAEEPTEALTVHRDHFAAMIRECPHVTTQLVHAMLDRSRFFTSSVLHDEKLVSLGRLAAGLAHELNNPASAAARGIRLLAQGLAESDQAARALAAARLSDAQLTSLDRVRAQSGLDPAWAGRPPLERSDREEALAAWLAAHGLDAGSAPALAASQVTQETLDRLAAALPAHVLDAGLRSIAAGAALRALAAEVESAVSRVHLLVSAVKGFTHMDRAPASDLVDLRRGLTDTVAVLGGKAREKSVTIEVKLADDLPRVLAHGGELNQVWANLIDNALDAVAPAGQVGVVGRREGHRVVIEIADDGPGIPPEIQGRIFDPFFTTKAVGEGTGLGLDIARRLVERNDGVLDFDTRPGRTVFRVSLPFAVDAGTQAS
jgi:signal transduction histidine kinase